MAPQEAFQFSVFTVAPVGYRIVINLCVDSQAEHSCQATSKPAVETSISMLFS